MSTVLAYTTPSRGHLYPMMSLLLELQDRGHDIHVRTIEAEVERLRAAGMHAEAVDPEIVPVPERHPDWKARNPKQALALGAATFAERAAYDAPDLERAVAQVQPDVIIVDINAWGAMTAAEQTGMPWVAFSPFVLAVASAGSPPFGPGLLPNDSLWGRLRDRVVGRLVLGAVAGEFLPRINEIRARHQLPPAADVSDFFTRADRILLTTSAPFDYPHPDWPSKIRSIGQIAWEPDDAAPDWLADLPDPLTLVTTSSDYQADESLARAAIAGLADEPGSVLVTMPAGVPDDLGPLPPNVRVEQFVPHRHALARADVAVTHGGMGATQKALASGVPVCVVPFGRDQMETAARIVHADAGTRLARKKLTPERLRDAVREAATKSEGARRCTAGYRAAGGAGAGAGAVEELL